MKQITDVLKELSRTLTSIDANEQAGLIAQIMKAERVFVAGVGRSGLMVRGFAMRLMHMGIEAYAVGEVVTPSITASDLLVIASGSGMTASLVKMAEKAKGIGAKVATVTIYPKAAIGEQADSVVKINAPTSKSEVDLGYQSIQPMGSLFEQSLLIFLDYCIVLLMNEKHITSEEMFLRHANLE